MITERNGSVNLVWFYINSLVTNDSLKGCSNVVVICCKENGTTSNERIPSTSKSSEIYLTLISTTNIIVIISLTSISSRNRTVHPPHISEYRPFRLQTIHFHVIFHTFSPSLPIPSPYISPLPLSNFYMPTPNYPQTNAPDAQTTSINSALAL